MFTKRDLLNDHLRERFHVSAPGVPAFSGLLLNVSKANLEFADVKYNNQPAEGHLFVDRHPGLHLQRLNDAPG